MKLREHLFRHWFLTTCGALLLLLAGYLIEEHIRGRVQLNSYMKRMRARGEKFTVAELTPTPAPPEKNGAGLMMGVGFGAGKVAPAQLPPSMRYIAPGIAVAAAREPVWAILKQGTFISTNGVTALWRTNTSTDTPVVRGVHTPMLITREDLAADVNFVSNSLTQLHAALRFPMLDQGLDYSAGFTMRLPHLAPEKGAAQWLRTASLNALLETNHAGALEELVALATLAHFATNEPLMISQLVRIAIEQIGVNAVWEALQVDGWTDAQLRELQTAMGPSDFSRAMAYSFEMERAMGLATSDRAAEDPNFLSQIMNDTYRAFGQSSSDEWDELGKSLSQAFLRFVYVPIWRLAWRDQEKLRVCEVWQTQIDSARAQAASPNWKKNVGRKKDEKSDEGEIFFDSPRPVASVFDRVRFPFLAMLGLIGDRTVQRAVDAEIAHELAVTAIALHRWEIAHGKFPATLQDLVPQFLPTSPLDPFDGQPLRYRLNEDGTFLLYSIGHNGKDDDGNAAPEKNDSRPQFLNGRDIVWPRAATPEEIQKFNEKEAARSRR